MLATLWSAGEKLNAAFSPAGGGGFKDAHRRRPPAVEEVPEPTGRAQHPDAQTNPYEPSSRGGGAGYPIYSQHSGGNPSSSLHPQQQQQQRQLASTRFHPYGGGGKGGATQLFQTPAREPRGRGVGGGGGGGGVEFSDPLASLMLSGREAPLGSYTAPAHHARAAAGGNSGVRDHGSEHLRDLPGTAAAAPRNAGGGGARWGTGSGVGALHRYPEQQQQFQHYQQQQQQHQQQQAQQLQQQQLLQQRSGEAAASLSGFNPAQMQQIAAAIAAGYNPFHHQAAAAGSGGVGGVAAGGGGQDAANASAFQAQAQAAAAHAAQAQQHQQSARKRPYDTGAGGSGEGEGGSNGGGSSGGSGGDTLSEPPGAMIMSAGTHAREYRESTGTNGSKRFKISAEDIPQGHGG